MRKSLRIIALAAIIAAASACTEKVEDKSGIGKGMLVLNSGSMGKGDAGIKFFASESDFDNNAFFSINGQHLGDTANDMIKVGDRIYIAVTNSKTIFVTDLSLKKVNQIRLDWSPRRLAADGGCIYVTLYEGRLGRIDVKTGSIQTTEVGPNPEGVAVSNGKIYVANSGGLVTDSNGRYIYDNTISVVDAAKFTEERRIVVNSNPCNLVAYGGKLYCHSLGDYGASPAKLQLIDLGTDAGSKLGKDAGSKLGTDTGSENNRVSEVITDLSDGSIPGLDSPSGLAFDGNRTIYVLNGRYGPDWKLVASVYSIDAETGSIGILAEQIADAYSICADARYIYVTTSDYKNNGNVHVFTSRGDLLQTIDSGGVNPIRVIDNF